MTRFIFIWVLLVFQTVHAQNTEPFMLKGMLISSENGQIIPLGNLLNKTTGLRAVSNRQGLFKIQVSQADTLRFSVVGFETYTTAVANIMPANLSDTIKVLLISKSYQLKDVTIVATNRKRDSLARAAAEILKTDPLLNNFDRIFGRPRGGFYGNDCGYSGLITELYYQFSKEGKDIARFESFYAYVQQQRAIEQKYNRELVKKVSGIPDVYLDDLLMHCRPDNDFALQADEYNMLLYIKNCSERFKILRGIK